MGKTQGCESRRLSDLHFLSVNGMVASLVATRQPERMRAPSERLTVSGQ